MLVSNIIHYNTNFIIKYINEKNIKKLYQVGVKGLLYQNHLNQNS